MNSSVTTMLTVKISDHCSFIVLRMTHCVRAVVSRKCPGTVISNLYYDLLVAVAIKPLKYILLVMQ